MKGIPPIPFALAALGIFALLGAGEVRSFERAAARDVSSRLTGDGKVVEVSTRPRGILGYATGDLASATIRAAHFSTEELPLFTEPERSKRGKLGRLQIVLNDFVLAGLHVDHLEATIPDCRFDLGLAQRHRKIRLSRSGIGRGSVRIREGDLAAYVMRRFHELTHVQVSISSGLVTVTGHAELIVFNVNFVAACRLSALNGDQLVLTDAKVTFDGLPADADAAKTLMRALNPVVDLNRDLRLHGAVKVENLDLKDGAIVASGPTTIPTKG